jgi:serine/threonine protein kinase
LKEYDSDDAIVNEHIFDPALLVDYPKGVRQYRRGKLLGQGNHSKVYEFIELGTDQIYAAKIIDKKVLERPSVWRKTHQELVTNISIADKSSDKVVNFHRYFEDENHLYMLTQYCKHETLEKLLKRRGKISEVEATIILR